MIHPSAEVQSENIGKDTAIWQHVIIIANAKIGNNCNITAHCFIENDVVIGNNVTVKCRVYLWDGIQIEDDVFIGQNVTFTNDKYPRLKKSHKIFQKAMIGAGSVVTKNIPPNELWLGNPARFIKKINKDE